ncbi:protein MIX23-like [Haliotis rufescens]|uniref:protein MIX23-like n=1 Tax=Haliotis rufescens TaxID=6454 RepID=UPI001EAFEAF3|nr:protein MIX23-like [Haliotis rufescens]
MAASSDEVTCDDFLGFQEALKKWRFIDDRIVYALNTSLPTASFAGEVNATSQCKHLYEQLAETYDGREQAIKKCVRTVSSVVGDLQNQKKNDPDNAEIMKRLSKERTKLRLMQSELNIEEVLRDRSMKVFYERCRTVYRPPSAPIV